MLGSLPSEITSELLTKNAVKYKELQVIGEDIYVVESRPEEEGRSCIYCVTQKKDMLPKPYSATNGVHEYGGKALCGEGKTLYFTNKSDGQIYSLIDGKGVKLSDCPNVRFAEPRVCGKVIFAVFEDHNNPENVINGIMRIDRETGKSEVFTQKHDFYAGLRVAPDQSSIAFFTWDFPNMSWDEADVWKLTLDQNQREEELKMISQKEASSSCDPFYSKDGHLFYISDETGFWNIYREDGSLFYKDNKDFTFPHWKMGQTRCAPLSKDEIACVYTDRATDHLGIIKNGKLEEIDLPFTFYLTLEYISGKLYFIATSPKHVTSVFSYDLKTKKLETLKVSQELDLDSSWISEPEEVEFKTRHGQKAFGFYYPPTNPNHNFGNEKPPLLMISHGGPTGHNPPRFDLGVLYWTSRGFGVVDVNYSGSTGFGRAYRNRLLKNWGILDVDDCEDCALFLADSGKVDKNRMVVRGGSAGGYTTLALLTFRDTFVAGASYFGVSDIGLLAEETHKFESKYMDLLVGDYPTQKHLFDERSPLYHTEKMKKPILILQGTEDKVVPVNQAELVYKALLENKVPTAYLLFEGEGHGFVMKKNIIKSIDSELYFYQTIFNQEKSFDTPPVLIENLQS